MLKPTKPMEYRGMTDEQLILSLRELERNLFQLRFQSATDRLETPSEIRKHKREIAKILTIQREKELVKVRQIPDEDLTRRLTDMEARIKEGNPVKRRALRSLKRLNAMKDSRTPEGAVKNV